MHNIEHFIWPKHHKVLFFKLDSQREVIKLVKRTYVSFSPKLACLSKSFPGLVLNFALVKYKKYLNVNDCKICKLQFM